MLKTLREVVRTKPDDSFYIKRFYYKVAENGLQLIRPIYVCQIQYSKTSGQIGIIYVQPEYRNKDLGKELLRTACNDIETKEVWGVSQLDHYYWNSYPHIFHKRYPVHSSVSNPGFYAKRSIVLSYFF